MREFFLKMIICEEFRTRVECGKFCRLKFVKMLFAYRSTTVSKINTYGTSKCTTLSIQVPSSLNVLV